MPKSKIEWTQHTWNPITGCTKTSEGCRNCYAESIAKRFGGESGQKACPLNPLWVKNLQKQCVKANVPFFFKQWGEFTCKNGEMIRVGKKGTGYLIDGKECREMPNKKSLFKGLD